MRSPNAQILPAPLKPATPQSPGRDVGTTDAGEPDASRPPPDTLREDVPLPPDDEVLLDPRGVTLEARFRWHGLPSPPASPEVNPDAISNAKRKAERTLLVDLSAANRMRIEVSGPAFPVPPGTELRARGDHYGHVLVWPDGQSYRILQPGTLEPCSRRGEPTSAPWSHPKSSPRNQSMPSATKRPPAKSRPRSEQHSCTRLPSRPWARVTCSVARYSSFSRRSLRRQCATRTSCRCAPSTRGRVGVSSPSRSLRSCALPVWTCEQLRIPPHTPSFKADRLPRPARATLLDTPDLQSLRKRPVPPEATEDGVTEDGLVAVNGAETIRYLLVDGVPVARVPPRSERRLETLRPGRYVLSWVRLSGRPDRIGSSTASPDSRRGRAGAGRRRSGVPGQELTTTPS